MRNARGRRAPPKTRPAGDPGRDVVLATTIEAMGGEGDGVAAGPIFAPYTLPGERVRLRGAGERRELDAVLEASAERVEPPCPHFGACGGCALQHWDLAPYLAWKAGRLAQT